MGASEIDKLKKSAEAAKNRYEEVQSRLEEKLAKVDERATMIYGRAARKVLDTPSNESYAVYKAINAQMSKSDIEWLKKHDL